MFTATNKIETITSTNDYFEIDKWCEVDTLNGWKCANYIKVGDRLRVDSDGDCVTVSVINIINLVDKNHILLYYK